MAGVPIDDPFDGNGQTPPPAGVITATVNGPWQDISDLGEFMVHCYCPNQTVGGSTPILKWSIEGSFDGSQPMAAALVLATSFTDVTDSNASNNLQSKTFARPGSGATVTVYPRYIRIVRTLSGTNPVFNSQWYFQSYEGSRKVVQ
jgi:hypothetical protein